MALELTYSHIEKPDAEPACLKRIPRVRVAQIVMDYLAHGWSADEMCRRHPYLRPAEIHAATAYNFDHQDKLDSRIQAEWRQFQHDRSRSAPSPFFSCLKARRSPQ